MKRREFLRIAALAPAAALAFSCAGRFRAGRARKVILIGIDGMDPGLARSYMDAGLMPNCSRLARMGTLSPLRTEFPPQSPVAWSSFITGTGPESHGIFDFIHRDPATLAPYLSTSAVEPGGRDLRLGSLRLPLEGSETRLLRAGDPFWKHLRADGTPVTLMKLPVDFPPVSAHGSSILCGLGTPDVRGSQGSFTFFTDNPTRISDDSAGGVVIAVRADDGRYACPLDGPPDGFREGSPACRTWVAVTADPASDGVLIDTGSGSAVLGRGEWSGWVPVEFGMLGGLSKVRSIARFHLRSVSPHLELYVSPLNMDPAHPSLPICSPRGFAPDLAFSLGPFHTKGFPEDTKALSRGVLDDVSYLDQALDLYDEQLSLMREGLGGFDEGLFFFYFSTLDLNVHMFYRDLDLLSPTHSTVMAEAAGIVPRLYSMMDGAVGEAMEAMDGDTMLLVFSDHGFSPFRRGFNLNSWLAAEGYARLFDPVAARGEMFAGTDWSTTSAYGLGINSLYLNLRGREEGGSVDPSQASALLDRIASGLLSAVDPATGLHPVGNVRILGGGRVAGLPPHAPDMLVGYSSGYRSSWDTSLGGYSAEVITDNTDPWSGDHCMDPDAVPGVLLSSVPLPATGPAIRDIGRTACSFLGSTTSPPGRDLLDG